ncbi:MAG: hypothetical protein JW901_10110 [Dehalococcoidia bacterium]|nr:hypothetical protein [Dehalococcoidia bacterium]
MNKIPAGLCQFAAIIIIILSAAISCAEPPPPVASANNTAPATAVLKVIDIVGIHEWEPLQESTLICALEDESDSSLKYSWSAEQGTLKGAGKQVTWIAPGSPGTFTITVQVSNAAGGGTTFGKDFQVTTNPYNNDTPDSTIYLKTTLPSDTVVTSAAHPKVWTTSEIQCVVEGSESSELTYQWTSSAGKLFGNDLEEGKASRVGWMAPGVAGDYTVSVIISDKSGNSASGEVYFDVYCCKP